MRVLLRYGTLVAALLGALPAHARAQTDNKIAVGWQMTVRRSPGEQIGGATSNAFTWRIGHDKNGWGWHYALNWFSTDVHTPIGPQLLGGNINGGAVELGELHIRPVLGGYGYTHVKGRAALTGSLLAGYAFSSLSVDPDAAGRYASGGMRLLDAKAANTFVLRPEFNMWYDLNTKMGLNVTAGYVIARPTLEVRSSQGLESRRVVADVVQVRVGLVYSIF